MELVIRFPIEEVNRVLQEGYSLNPGTNRKLASRNAWLYLNEKADDSKECLVCVSSENPKAEKETEPSANGIHLWNWKGKIEAKDILRTLPVRASERTSVLMNTSMIDESWCRPVFLKILHSKQKVCILAFSFFDDTKTLDDWNRQYQEGRGIWYRSNTDVFFAYGIRKEDITWVNYFTDSKEQMLDAIANSDVLMLPGGAPDLMMKRIKEKKLKKILRNYQGVVIGYSAGAMVQLEKYHITPDEDYPEYGWYQGLGYIRDLDIEVHYQANNHQKSYIQKAMEDSGLPVTAICEKGGMVIYPDGKKEYFGKVFFFGEKNMA